ncbi:hypothetical protein Lfu02_74920 [Longispora fulva]|uniref:Biotin carboxylase n=1 Tax=Longispora fulva TaxID=619741 RepID=A0A8J7GEE3_9ACTN|nr:ATP-grasp domain-containing protein [Longispora fulva]MBG6134228.1 biotin carboxylase [Longispora fulva]GIG63120.1 hypothetical protein Lfu02_74920 [Longispora fulva]
MTHAIPVPESATTDEAPLLAVVYAVGSASPIEILRAAQGLCTVVFLFDRGDVDGEMAAEFFEEFGGGRDVTGQSAEAVAELLAGRNVAGITTFSEFKLTYTAALSTALRLLFHNPVVAERLSNKASQRGCLAAAEVDSVRFRKVPSAEGVPVALDEVGFPAVVKPTVGAASRNAFRVDSTQHWKTIADGHSLSEELIVEQFLVGDTSKAGDAWGDYVSVEAVSVNGQHACFAVLGKTPLAPPFRESGMFYPSTLGVTGDDEVCRLAARALDAIGVRNGVTQTEVKLTSSGPRVIEVNGRLGGYVADIVRRSGGEDPVRLALRAALGDGQLEFQRPTASGVAFQIFLPAPVERSRIKAVAGLDDLRALDGVDSVWTGVRPGDVIDAADGTRSYLGIVHGHVPDHDALAGLITLARQTLEVEFSPAAATGQLPSRE